MKYNLALIEKLWQKYSYQHGNRYMSDRDKIVNDYFKETGVMIPKASLDNYVRKLNLKELYLTKETTFNERTDRFIDEPTSPMTERELLLRIGFDPEEFELRWDKKVGTVNHWWLDKGGLEERIRNGQIKIDLWKKKFVVTQDLIVKAYVKAIQRDLIKPKHINRTVKNGKHFLSLFLTDLHFGYMTDEDYEEQQAEIIEIIESEDWEEIVIVIGSDIFHVDNKQGTTTAGTQVGHEVDLNNMYEYAYRFKKPIFESSLKHSERVKGMHIEGNHDENTSFGFAWGLSKEYPQIEWDLSDKLRKHHRYEDVLIIYTHGHLPRNYKDMYKVVFEEFKSEIATAKTVELHMGDKHHQWSQEEIGIMMRGLGAPKKTDKWHYNSGFIGSRRVMQIFKYDHEKLKGQFYIG